MSDISCSIVAPTGLSLEGEGARRNAEETPDVAELKEEKRWLMMKEDELGEGKGDGNSIKDGEKVDRVRNKAETRA